MIESGQRAGLQLQGLLGNWSTLDGYQRGNLTIPALLLGSALTERGFTGHRQLDGVGLIHMGGRVYDAEIGRFLSADPFTGDSTNLQALNRYTYVENNPLSYTDPSGYFLKKLVKGIGRAIGKVLDGVAHVIKVALQKIGRVFGEVPGLSAAIGAMACVMLPTSCVAIQKGMMALSTAITAANGGTIAQVLKAGAIAFVRAGLEQKGGGATPFGSRGSDSPGMIFHLDTAAKSVGQDGARSWFKEDFLPEIVARLRKMEKKMEKKAQAKIRNESSSAVPQSQQPPAIQEGESTESVVRRAIALCGADGQGASGTDRLQDILREPDDVFDVVNLLAKSFGVRPTRKELSAVVTLNELTALFEAYRHKRAADAG